MLMNRFIYPLISNNTVKLIICNDVLVFLGFSYELVRTQHACFIIPYLNLYNKSSNWSGPILMKKHDSRFITYHLQFLHLALFVMSSLFTKTLKNNSVLLFFTFDWAYARKLVDEPSESRRIEYNRTNPNMLLNNMLCRWRSFGLFIPIDNEGDEFTCNPARFSPTIRFYDFITCNIRSFADLLIGAFVQNCYVSYSF